MNVTAAYNFISSLVSGSFAREGSSDPSSTTNLALTILGTGLVLTVGTICLLGRVCRGGPSSSSSLSGPPVPPPRLVIGQSTCNTGIGRLPKDVLTLVLSQLPAKDLARAACVSKQFYHAAQDAVPQVFRINEAIWRQYVDLEKLGLSFEGTPAVDDREKGRAIKGMSHHVEERAGVTVLSLPKGLTLNMLLQIAKANNVPIADVWDEILDQLGDKAVETPCTVVLTNSVLKGSRKMSFTDQQAHLAKLLGTGYEVPELLPVLALMIFTYIDSGGRIRLFPRAPGCLTYTRCQEQLLGLRLAAVGFGPIGLLLYSTCSFDIYFFGVGGQRKF
jgi:hypothetical protein